VRAELELAPELVELLRRYRDGLNMAIKWAVGWSGAKGCPPILTEARKALYELLKAMELSPRIAAECYREVPAIVKSYLANGAKGKVPVAKSLHM